MTTKPNSSTGNDRSIHPGSTWEQFKLIQKNFENTRGVRLSYYNGTIELRKPSPAYDRFKKVISVLLETFLLDREIEFTPTGSAFQEEAGIAALEPDESYQIGYYRLAIEINFTHGNKAKLAPYLALGIDEVWCWEDARLVVYQLNGDAYETVEQSQIPALTPIDIAALSQAILAGETSIVAATKAFRATQPQS
jgi:Putative restriction endonuclease